MEELADLISSGKYHNIILVVGAGISVASGIPDFRSPKVGLYASIKETAALKKHRPTFVFEIDVFKNDPHPFWWIFSKMWPATAAAQPTPFHFLMQMLHKKGLLLRVYTQNVDGLEELAGLPRDKVIHAHGVMSTLRCLQCGAVYPMSFCMPFVLANLSDPNNTIETTQVPKCTTCGSNLVKPDVVFFEEDLPDLFYDQYPIDFPKCDLLIIAGTSLEVYPCAGLVSKVEKTVKRFLVNKVMVKCAHRFHFSTDRDWFIEGDVQDFALALAEKLGWGPELRELVTTRVNMEQHVMKTTFNTLSGPGND